MEEHFVFPPDARAHDQSRRQKTALLQAEIRKAVKRSVVAGSSFDRFLCGMFTAELISRILEQITKTLQQVL